MVQNHLFQVLSLVVMDPPSTLDDVSIMQEKLKIFKELKLAKDFHNHIVF
jgi:glucose-6-phosphate 1-dehydrogenase